MKIGDKVTMDKVWKYDSAIGVIDNITSDYVVVRWNDIPGYWHYTEQQAKRLEVIDDVDWIFSQ